jgi:hypothetical protein
MKKATLKRGTLSSGDTENPVYWIYWDDSSETSSYIWVDDLARFMDVSEREGIIVEVIEDQNQ